MRRCKRKLAQVGAPPRGQIRIQPKRNTQIEIDQLLCNPQIGRQLQVLTNQRFINFVMLFVPPNSFPNFKLKFTRPQLSEVPSLYKLYNDV